VSPYNTSAEFLAESKKKTNRPVILVALEITDSQTLYFARDNEDVTYFKPRTSTPQVYTKFWFTAGPQGSNVEGQIDTLNVRASNVFQELGGLIQYYGGLLGNKITTIIAFKDLLDDSNACIVNEYYIDAPGGSKQAVEFKCSTKFNTLNVRLPREVYSRNYCQYRYMPTPLYQGTATSIVENVLYDSVNLPVSVPLTITGRVLYMTGNGTAYGIIYVKNPNGIVVDRNISYSSGLYKIGTECGYFGGLPTCDHTKECADGCVAHNNVLRFGAQPGIPRRRPYTM